MALSSLSEFTIEVESPSVSSVSDGGVGDDSRDPQDSLAVVVDSLVFILCLPWSCSRFERGNWIYVP